MNDLIRGKKNLSPSKRARRARLADERRKLKRADALERQTAHDALSLLEKIAKLDRKLGPNVGAVKERARLKAALEAQTQVAESAVKAKEISTNKSKKK